MPRHKMQWEDKKNANCCMSNSEGTKDFITSRLQKHTKCKVWATRLPIQTIMWCVQTIQWTLATFKIQISSRINMNLSQCVKQLHEFACWRVQSHTPNSALCESQGDIGPTSKPTQKYNCVQDLVNLTPAPRKKRFKVETPSQHNNLQWKKVEIKMKLLQQIWLN